MHRQTDRQTETIKLITITLSYRRALTNSGLWHVLPLPRRLFFCLGLFVGLWVCLWTRGHCWACVFSEVTVEPVYFQRSLLSLCIFRGHCWACVFSEVTVEPVVWCLAVLWYRSLSPLSCAPGDLCPHAPLTQTPAVVWTDPHHWSEGGHGHFTHCKYTHGILTSVDTENTVRYICINT